LLYYFLESFNRIIIWFRVKVGFLLEMKIIFESWFFYFSFKIHGYKK
jgi:hypothetical protein